MGPKTITHTIIICITTSRWRTCCQGVYICTHFNDTVILQSISVYQFDQAFLNAASEASKLIPDLLACKQRADHFTPMMWFDLIRWRFHLIRRRFHYSNCIRYNQNDVTQNCISPESHNWYIYTAWEIETPNLWLTQMLSQGGVGGQKIFACLRTYVLFVEQPVVS